MVVGVSMKPMGYWCWHRTTTEGVESVRGHQIFPLPLLEGNIQDTSDKALLLVSNLLTDLG